MRQGPNGRRPRSRHHGGGGGGGNSPGNNSGGSNNPGGNNNNRPRSAASLRHQNFDSNCIELRVRGNAWQVHEKYQALARDATSAGDRVAAENYLQHAEHYYRIIEAINEATAAEQRTRPPQFEQQPNVPTNYYGGATQPSPEGGSASPGAPGAPGAPGTGTQAPMAQAEVERVQKSPFFSQEDAEEPPSSEAMVAQR